MNLKRTRYQQVSLRLEKRKTYRTCAYLVGEMKSTQELLLHSSPIITLGTYAKAVTADKRIAQDAIAALFVGQHHLDLFSQSRAIWECLRICLSFVLQQLQKLLCLCRHIGGNIPLFFKVMIQIKDDRRYALDLFGVETVSKWDRCVWTSCRSQ